MIPRQINYNKCKKWSNNINNNVLVCGSYKKLLFDLFYDLLSKGPPKCIVKEENRHTQSQILCSIDRASLISKQM